MDFRKVFGDDVLYDEPMAKHTTFAIGGPADVFCVPKNETELEKVWNLAHKHHVSVTLLGNASNVLVSDKGIRGVVLSLKGLNTLTVKGTTVLAGAGVTMGILAKVSADAGLTGLEFAAGIPGSVGGGAFMNAGAYDGSMSDVVKAVRFLDAKGEWHSLCSDELGFGYRKSAMQEKDGIITSVLLELAYGDKDQIHSKISELQKCRSSKQPLNLPSAGSVFKRPDGYFAAALIDECGLKGTSVGGAEVSTKHAGFIVNNGNAKAADVMALIKKIQDCVWEKKHVRLETEVVLLGEWQ